MLIPFDIETIPTTDDDDIAEIAKSISPPATIKLPASIAKWRDEHGAKAIADAVSKTSFNGLYGQIACIACARDDGDVFVSASDDESNVINEFYDAIRDYVRQSEKDHHYQDSPVFCGHNIAGFDLQFLKHRSIILGIKPPPDIMLAMSAKPWDKCIADTMLMWSSDSQKRTSMDKLCKAFGIDGKGDFDGSMVANEWFNGDRNKVREYCQDDVRRTRELYKRITFA